MFELTYDEAVLKADHLKALGVKEVYLRGRDAGYPWDLVTKVVPGALWRLNAPASVHLAAQSHGLTFTWSVDFETPESNGAPLHMFDRSHLRKVMARLPPEARKMFAAILRDQVLPEVNKARDNMQKAIDQQDDGIDCLNAIIAEAEGQRV